MGFSHFSPAPKKCEGYPPVESESARVSSSELGAHQMAPAGESNELADKRAEVAEGAQKA